MSEKSELTSGWKARQYVQELKPFHNNSKTGSGPKDSTLWGEWQTFADGKPSIYVVYSYRRNFPIYANWKGVWFANKDKFSRTTSKHQSQAHPLTQCVPVERIDLEYLALFGEPVPELLVRAAQLKLLPDELIHEATKARITA